jgi:TPR repeat protein
MKRFAFAAFAVTGFSLASCGGGAGNVVRPEDYKGADALGVSAPVCSGEPKFARPLTVDLDPDTRVDLEASMKSGVVVVSYDCVNLRILDNCRLASGSYEYAGVSRKEEVVQMKGLDELKVNLPLGAAKLESEVQAGRTLDLALVSVGRRSTTVSSVASAELGGSCDGATHYVQKASVGAFSMATGSVGKVSAVADLFAHSASGSSSSERSASRSDGSLEACRTSDPDAEKPPGECRSPLRVELIPIAKGSIPEAAGKATVPAAVGVEARQDPCREGYKLVEGVCSNELDEGYLCDPADDADCRAQCDKGNAGSCVNVGASIANQYWKVGWPKAKADARPFFKKACDAGDQDGCAGYVRTAFPLESEAAAKLAEAQALLALGKTACDAGVGMACFDLGTHQSDVYEGQPFHDRPAALRSFERACALGYPDACNTAGLLYMSTDKKKGMSLYARGCDGGDGFVCNQMALRFVTGMDGIEKDSKRGEVLTWRACELNIENCGFTAELLLKLGKEKDASKAAERGCNGEDLRKNLDEGARNVADQYRGAACQELGEIHAEGKGVRKDPKRAKELYDKGCKLGSRTACAALK